MRVLDTQKLAIVVEEAGPTITYEGKLLRRVDAIVPRISARITFYGTAVVRQFEQMGVFTLVASHAISVSRDKLRSMQILSRHRIGMPPTVFVRDKVHVKEAIERVGGAPVVIKVLEGTQGVGVILAETIASAQSIIETLQMAYQNVLIQRFVAESAGRDIRAFVVGGRVVAAMRRISKNGNFRANLHQGGDSEAVRLPAEYETMAIRAAQVLGLRVAGVDILEGQDGPKVIEVNASPGLEGIEAATGIDVAGAMIEHIEDEVSFPEVDLRQRLTLKSGYGVAEIKLTRRSALVGRRVGETQPDVRILSILRGSVSIPNPAPDCELLPGDVIIGFGKLLTLKSLLPPKRQRRRTGEILDGPAFNEA
jgi:ribosomal protein S6--L-glutamate ligase